MDAEAIFPSSTGVIGWSLPVEAMLAALPNAVAALAGPSIMPAAEGIVTTDLYPKVRRAAVGGGSIVGIAKGAGMIEPNMATMLVYNLTDLAITRAALRTMLTRVVEESGAVARGRGVAAGQGWVRTSGCGAPSGSAGTC